MKITICGSMLFFDKMQEIKRKLEDLNHEVQIPVDATCDNLGNKISIVQFYELRQKADESQKWIWDTKENLIWEHFRKIEWCDCVLILNYEKKGIAGYVGGNTFLEMGLAFYLKKNIYLLNSIPDIGYKEEIFALKPVVLNNDLSKLT